MKDFLQQTSSMMNQQAVSDILRRMATDEVLKARCLQDRNWYRIALAVAAPYIAGSTSAEGVAGVEKVLARGHRASIECMGESCRERAMAERETQVFLDLIRDLDAKQLPSSISFDLSHIGSEIDPDLGFENASRIARAAAVSNREVMISMEGAARIDTILSVYRRLHEEGGSEMAHVGITIQARMHRSAQDLAGLIEYPGKIRLVKGAYLEPASIAYPLDSHELHSAFLSYAKQLIQSGHPCSIATHDASLQAEICDFIDANDLERGSFEFESLIGLGTNQIDALRERGMPTREYVVYGQEFYLYVLNRIAENPQRLFPAIVAAFKAYASEYGQ